MTCGDTDTGKPDGEHSRSNDTEEEELGSWKIKAIRLAQTVGEESGKKSKVEIKALAERTHNSSAHFASN